MDPTKGGGHGFREAPSGGMRKKSERCKALSVTRGKKKKGRTGTRPRETDMDIDRLGRGYKSDQRR